MKRWPLVASFVLFIALCMSLTFWAMLLFKKPVRQVVPPPQAPRQEVRIDTVVALFGGRPAAAAVAVNFQLKGVVMSDVPTESVAILSADGKPPQAVRVNKDAGSGVTVKEIHPRYVVLQDGGISKRVDLQVNVGSGLTNVSAPTPSAAPMPMMGGAPVLQASPETPPPNPNPPPAPIRP